MAEYSSKNEEDIDFFRQQHSDKMKVKNSSLIRKEKVEVPYAKRDFTYR